MAAPRKYPGDLRERAVGMAVDLRRDPETPSGALKRWRRVEQVLSADGGLVGEDLGAVALVAVVRGDPHGELLAVGGHLERVAGGHVAGGGPLLERECRG